MILTYMTLTACEVLAGLFVDAKHAAARQYYLQFGFLAAPDQLENLVMSVRAIRESLKR